VFQNFFANDPRAKATFELLMDTKLTVGMLRQALAECPRLKPFSERAIDTYLQQQTVEGSTNGHL
jgi:hypothetical protein